MLDGDVVGFCFQAEGGIRDLVRSRGLGDVYKRQVHLGLVVQLGVEVRTARGEQLAGLVGDGAAAAVAGAAVAEEVVEAEEHRRHQQQFRALDEEAEQQGKEACLLYTSPSPRDRTRSRMPSSA
mgnify:CR=1 FL=1